MYTVTDERGNIRLMSGDQIFDKINDPQVEDEEKERFIGALAAARMTFLCNRQEVVISNKA